MKKLSIKKKMRQLRILKKNIKKLEKKKLKKLHLKKAEFEKKKKKSGLTLRR